MNRKKKVTTQSSCRTVYKLLTIISNINHTNNHVIASEAKQSINDGCLSSQMDHHADIKLPSSARDDMKTNISQNENHTNSHVIASEAKQSINDSCLSSQMDHHADIKLSSSARDDKQAAFSLIEAMIILVLISVSVMALIPLMTKKSTVNSWEKMPTTTANQNIVTYGADKIDRVGLGASPYATTDDGINAKLAVKDLYYSTSDIAESPSRAANNNITWGDWYATSSTYSEFAMWNDTTGKKKYETNTMQLGANLTIRTTPYIDVGADPANKRTNIFYNNDAYGFNLSYNYGSGIHSLVKLNNNDDFSFSTTNTADPNIMSYTSSNKTLTIYPKINVQNFYALIGSTTKPTLSQQTVPKTCTPMCSGMNDDFTADDTKHCCDDQYYYNKIKFTESSSSDSDSDSDSATTSDRRLKNIISNYKKGIDEINKISTYIFTFKSDKRKQLHAGVIAQKLIGVFDEALHQDEKGFYSYEKPPILYAMVNSVQSINKKQDALLKKQQKTSDKADKLIRMYK